MHKVQGVLLLASVLVILCGVAIEVLHLMDSGVSHELTWWFDFDHEENVPATYSALLILLTAAGAFVAGISTPTSMMASRAFWLLACIALILMATDEFFQFHEKTSNFSVAGLLTAVAYNFRWIAVGFLVVVATVLVYLPFRKRLPPKTAFRLEVAGMVYFGGAFGFECLAALLDTVYSPRPEVPYSVLVICEESMEMFGVLLVLNAIVKYLKEELDGVAQVGKLVLRIR